MGEVVRKKPPRSSLGSIGVDCSVCGGPASCLASPSSGVVWSVRRLPRHPQATLHSEQRSGVRTTFNSTVQRRRIQAAPVPREAPAESAGELQSPFRSQIGRPDHSSEVSGQRVPSDRSGLWLAENVVLPPSLPNSGLIFEWWAELDATFVKKS